MINYTLTIFYQKQNTIVNCLPVVTTFGQLLASEDEFGEGDGIAVVLCGLSPVVVRNEFAIV